MTAGPVIYDNYKCQVNCLRRNERLQARFRSTCSQAGRCDQDRLSRRQLCKGYQVQKVSSSVVNVCGLRSLTTPGYGPRKRWSSPTLNCPRNGSCRRRPMSALGRSNTPLPERRSTELVSQAPRPPNSLAWSCQQDRTSNLSHTSPKCTRLWFPGKGTRNMSPQVPGLFYSTKLQVIITCWKPPQNFASNKVLRWVEYSVKVEFKKGLPFCRLQHVFNVSNRLARIGSV
jgi:hypothetical protein